MDANIRFLQYLYVGYASGEREVKSVPLSLNGTSCIKPEKRTHLKPANRG